MLPASYSHMFSVYSVNRVCAWGLQHCTVSVQGLQHLSAQGLQYLYSVRTGFAMSVQCQHRVLQYLSSVCAGFTLHRKRTGASRQCRGWLSVHHGPRISALQHVMRR